MSDVIEDLLVASDDAAGEKCPSITKALADSDESYFRALSRCGDQPEECVELVEKWLTADGRLRKFQQAIADLVAKHEGDERYQKLCRNAFESRADLAALETQESLSEWWPGCSHIRQPH